MTGNKHLIPYRFSVFLPQFTLRHFDNLIISLSPDGTRDINDFLTAGVSFRLSSSFILRPTVFAAKVLFLFQKTYRSHYFFSLSRFYYFLCLSMPQYPYFLRYIKN